MIQALYQALHISVSWERVSEIQSTKEFCNILQTQSQNPKAFSGSMPKALTSLRLVLTATMCLAVASAPSSAVSHVLHSKGCHEKTKGKEKTAPFGINLMRSEVLYPTAQVVS